MNSFINSGTNQSYQNFSTKNKNKTFPPNNKILISKAFMGMSFVKIKVEKLMHRGLYGNDILINVVPSMPFLAKNYRV